MKQRIIGIIIVYICIEIFDIVRKASNKKMEKEKREREEKEKEKELQLRMRIRAREDKEAEIYKDENWYYPNRYKEKLEDRKREDEYDWLTEDQKMDRFLDALERIGEMEKSYDNMKKEEERRKSLISEKNKNIHKRHNTKKDEDKNIQNKIDNKKPKIYFSWKTSDKDFWRFRKIVEHLLDYYHNPTLKEIEEEGKFLVFFHEWKAYLVRWEDVIIKDEIKLDNPKKYYPKDWKDWDPIPAETINRTIAEKLWISYEILKDHLWIEWNFTK